MIDEFPVACRAQSRERRANARAWALIKSPFCRRGRTWLLTTHWVIAPAGVPGHPLITLCSHKLPITGCVDCLPTGFEQSQALRLNPWTGKCGVVTKRKSLRIGGCCSTLLLFVGICAHLLTSSSKSRLGTQFAVRTGLAVRRLPRFCYRRPGSRCGNRNREPSQERQEPYCSRLREAYHT